MVTMMYLAIRGLYAQFCSGNLCRAEATTQIKETIPSLAELGGRQLYPTDPSAGMSLSLK
jgi:hypothetical protein